MLIYFTSELMKQKHEFVEKIHYYIRLILLLNEVFVFQVYNILETLHKFGRV